MFAKILAVAVCLFGLAQAGALYNGVANYAGIGYGAYGGYGGYGNGYGYAGRGYAPAVSYAVNRVVPISSGYYAGYSGLGQGGYNGVLGGYGGYGYRGYSNGLYGGYGYNQAW